MYVRKKWTQTCTYACLQKTCIVNIFSKETDSQVYIFQAFLEWKLYIERTRLIIQHTIY